jgi:hypothetical protein
LKSDIPVTVSGVQIPHPLPFKKLKTDKRYAKVFLSSFIFASGIDEGAKNERTLEK